MSIISRVVLCPTVLIYHKFFSHSPNNGLNFENYASKNSYMFIFLPILYCFFFKESILEVESMNQRIWTYFKFLKLSCCSFANSCLTLCDLMDYSTPGFLVHHHLPQVAQTYVHWVSDAIQSFHPLLSLSPPAFCLSPSQGIFQWVSSLHQVAKVLEFQPQYQSFHWVFRVDFL